jgi:hypothetical protein
VLDDFTQDTTITTADDEDFLGCVSLVVDVCCKEACTPLGLDETSWQDE